MAFCLLTGVNSILAAFLQSQMGWGHPPVGVVSNRVMVAVYVVRREGVIRMYPMREDLRGFSQRLKRFY